MSNVLDRIRARREGRPSIPLEVPEWELKAFIRPLSAGKMASLQKQGNPAIMAAQVIIHGVVDESGKPIFKDDAETLAALTGEEYDLIDRVSAEIGGARTGFDTVDDAKNS